MTARFSFALSLLFAVPVLVLLIAAVWLFAGVLAAFSTLAAQLRRGGGGVHCIEAKV